VKASASHEVFHSMASTRRRDDHHVADGRAEEEALACIPELRIIRCEILDQNNRQGLESRARR